MCPMTVVEVSLLDMAITSTLMADLVPTTFGQGIGIMQHTQETPVDAAEVAAPAHVLVPAPEAAAPGAAKKTHMVLQSIGI